MKKAKRRKNDNISKKTKKERDKNRMYSWRKWTNPKTLYVHLNESHTGLPRNQKTYHIKITNEVIS